MLTVQAAEPRIDPYDGDWHYLSVREATEVGVAGARRDRASAQARPDGAVPPGQFAASEREASR